MISLPILLLPTGELVDMTGTGGTTPGGEENVLGSEAFLGLLQQLLLGSAVQTQPGQVLVSGGSPFSATGPPGVDPATLSPVIEAAGSLPALPLPGGAMPTTEGGVTVPTFPLPPGTAAEAGRSPAATPVPVQPGDPPRPVAEEVADVSAEKNVRPPAPPGIQRQGPQPFPPDLLSLGRSEKHDARGILAHPVVSSVPESDTREILSVPLVSGKTEPGEKVPGGHGTRQAKEQGTSSDIALRHVTTQRAIPKALFTTSNIPVSSMEGNSSPGRLQDTAPATKEAVKSPVSLQPADNLAIPIVSSSASEEVVHGRDPGPLSRATAQPVHAQDADDGGDATTVREGERDAVKPLPVPAAHAQSGEGRDTSGHRSQFLPSEAAGIMPKGDQASVRETFRVPDFLRTLMPEAAQNVVDQVVKGFSLHVQGESSEMRVKLEPESLGEVVLHVRMDNGKMQAQIDVTQAAVKAVLDTNLGQLRHMLLTRGIEVQRIDVALGGDSHMRESGNGGGDRHGHQNARREYSTELVEQYQTGRMLGYNTMELIM